MGTAPGPAVLPGRDVMAFDPEGDAFVASTPGGRTWRVTEERTGWRLQFVDPGDPCATNAGVHRTLEAAIAEANRVPNRGGRRR